MTEKKFAPRGVGYYNKDNKDNRDNKDNTKKEFPSSSDFEGTTPLLEPTIDDLSPGQKEDGVLDPSVTTQAPTPDEPIDPHTITPEFVHRALFTLYDNGEHSQQRWKFGITINPAENPNKRIEFLGSLTKDLRNFKKYLPEGVSMNDVNALRHHIKEQYKSWPYIGKIHFNEGRKDHSQKTSNEPYCWVAAWYVPQERAWDYWVNIYDWEHNGHLYSNNLTKQQELANVKCTDIWFNPQYQHQQLTGRNKTFAQRMRARKQ